MTVASLKNMREWTTVIGAAVIILLFILERSQSSPK